MATHDHRAGAAPRRRHRVPRARPPRRDAPRPRRFFDAPPQREAAAFLRGDLVDLTQWREQHEPPHSCRDSPSLAPSRRARPRSRRTSPSSSPSTTSTQDSGLFGHILPMFKAKTGIDVKVVSQGTGQALDTGRRGDADVVFVHAKPQEEKFVADGFGVKRYAVMYNDFVLIGPKSDPAGVKGKDIVTALEGDQGQGRAVHLARRQVRHALGRARPLEGRRASTSRAPTRAPGIARSGRAWARRSTPRRPSNAYVLADRGTWLSFKNRGDLDIVVEGDKRLFNQYGVMLVNPAKHAAREEGAWPAVHRLAGVGGRPEGDRRLQDQRPAAVLPERQRCRARDAHARLFSSRFFAVMTVAGESPPKRSASRRRQPARAR